MDEKSILSKIEPINALLESQFGIRMGLSSFEHLVDVRQLYDAKRQRFIETMGAAQAMSVPEYTKAVLISEAARLMLKEIAPKRLSRKR